MKFPASFDGLHNALRAAMAPLDALAALVPEGASVLELGCGQGLLLQALRGRASKLAGIDYDPRKCRMARELLGDAAEIVEGELLAYLESLAPGAFDVLVLSDTLSSFPLPEQDRVLALAASRLGPRGRLVLSFVDGRGGMKRLLAESISRVTYALRVSRSHAQEFTYRPADELESVLARAGCRVERHTLHRFPPRPIPHVALVAQLASAPRRPSVTFAILNLRLGGQVSGMTVLAEALERRGMSVRWALPEGCASAAKPDVDAFAALPFSTRLKRTWDLLRTLRPRDEGDVLQLVLPSPAFAALAASLAWPEERTLVQYEGPSTSLDATFAAALAQDPALLIPRLVLNNGAWAPLARSLRVTHLASHPSIERQLRQCGFTRVALVENLGDAALGEGALDATAQLERGAGEVWLAYAGHAHPVKGVDLLVEAFQRICAARPELRLLLALTRDGRSEALRRRVQAGPVSSRIRIEGLVKIADLLRQVDALVLPYRSALTTTLYPSLLLEADAAHCPLIVSRLPELAPVLAWSSPALHVVTPGDVDSLAQALLKVSPRKGTAWSPILALRPATERVDAMLRLYESLLR